MLWLRVTGVKGLVDALWFGYLGSCDGVETSRGIFSDLFKIIELKKIFRFSTKSTPKSRFRAPILTILAIFGNF